MPAITPVLGIQTQGGRGRKQKGYIRRHRHGVGGPQGKPKKEKKTYARRDC